MMTSATPVPAVRAAGSLYRAIWRWHFYAGLIVLPVLLWMAITGAAYLYHAEIERLVYAGWVSSPVTGPPLAISEMIAAVAHQTGGTVTAIAVPAIAADSWRMTVELDDRSTLTAFVRPESGQVLGSVESGGIAETIKHLHSLTVAGPVGNVLVEIVAGWSVVLAVTGLYLWWPRGANRALSFAGRTSERRFWRNLHASTGALAGLVLVFLAVTGMPWSIFWGERFHGFVAEAGIGRPKPAAAPPGGHGEHDAALPWSLRGQAPAAGHGSHDIGADAAFTIAEERRVARPLTLGLPSAPGKPYLVSHAAMRQQDAHVVYVDREIGAVLLDARGSEFGIGARAFEFGIYTHQGQQFGEVNRLVMLAACVGVVLLSITAPMLWWKRRRSGRLNPPPRADDRSRERGAALVMLGVGALFPLTGATMLAALAGEALLGRARNHAIDRLP